MFWLVRAEKGTNSSCRSAIGQDSTPHLLHLPAQPLKDLLNLTVKSSLRGWGEGLGGFGGGWGGGGSLRRSRSRIGEGGGVKGHMHLDNIPAYKMDRRKGREKRQVSLLTDGLLHQLPFILLRSQPLVNRSLDPMSLIVCVPPTTHTHTHTNTFMVYLHKEHLPQLSDPQMNVKILTSDGLESDRSSNESRENKQHVYCLDPSKTLIPSYINVTQRMSIQIILKQCNFNVSLSYSYSTYLFRPILTLKHFKCSRTYLCRETTLKQVKQRSPTLNFDPV